MSWYIRRLKYGFSFFFSLFLFLCISFILSMTSTAKVMTPSNDNVFLFIPNIIGKNRLVSIYTYTNLQQDIREFFWLLYPCIICLNILKYACHYTVSPACWTLLMEMLPVILVNVIKHIIYIVSNNCWKWHLLGSKFGAVLDMVTDR